MKRSLLFAWLMPVALGLTLLSGCTYPSPAAAPPTLGIVSATGAAPSSITLPALPQLTPAGPLVVSGDAPQVTLTDSGRPVMMHVGDRFLLNLGEGYDWSVEAADPAVVSRVISVLTVEGSQGLFEAHKTGRTTLTAAGDPPCRKANPPCGAPSRLFQVEVIVQ
jgi:hypothetical protein